MHHIQQFILAQLSEQNHLRYSDMRPPTMEASQFMYHLNLLQKQHLVTKTPDGMYALSAMGKQYIDRAHDDSLLPRSQPRIAALVVCRDEKRGTVYAKRLLQPAVGYCGFPLIDIPIGFDLPLQTFVEQMFQQQVGLVCQLQHRADGYINLLQHGELEGSLLAHIFSGESPTGELQQPDTMYSYFWGGETQTFNPTFLSSVSYVENLLATHPEDTFFEYEFSIGEADTKE